MWPWTVPTGGSAVILVKCVSSDCPTSQPFPLSLLLLRSAYSLRLRSIEIRAVNNPAVASECMCVSRSVVSNSLWPLDCSPPGSSVHGILQARRLERVAIPLSGGPSWPRDQTPACCIAGRFFPVWATGWPSERRSCLSLTWNRKLEMVWA